MKLTKERVEGLRRTIIHGLTCKPQSLEDLCDGWLEMHEQAVQHEALKEAVRAALDNSIIIQDSS